jgi:hypothetical protein
MGKSKEIRSTDTKEALQVIAVLKTKHNLEVEEIIDTLKVLEDSEQRADNRKLRNRVVWWIISSVTFEGLLVLLHSIGLITLPQAVLIAISVMMGGSGLVAALLIILKDLFPQK